MEINYSGVETHCKLLIWVQSPNVPGKTQIKWMCGLYPFLVSRCPHPKKTVGKLRSNEALTPACQGLCSDCSPTQQLEEGFWPTGPRRKFTAEVQWEQHTRLHLGIHSFSATLYSPSGSSNPQVIANTNFLAEFPKEMRLRQSLFLAGFPSNLEPSGWCQPSGIDRQTLCCDKFYRRGERESNQNLFPTKGRVQHEIIIQVSEDPHRRCLPLDGKALL